MAEVSHIFDRKALALKKARAARRSGENFLAEEAARGVAHRLSAVNRDFVAPVALDIPAPAFAILKDLTKTWAVLTFGENEHLPLEPQSCDLVVSVLSLHTVNDLPGALIQIRRALRPDGLFMAALFAGDTLHELRESFVVGEERVTGGASPRISPFADVRDLGALLQRAGYALPVADMEHTTVRYRRFATLVNDLRVAGETNVLAARERKMLRRDVLAASLSHYAENHVTEDGRLRATFGIAYLTGWAPHESQQKPLRPGSAKTRLADALGTSEQTAGDTTPLKRD